MAIGLARARKARLSIPHINQRPGLSRSRAVSRPQTALARAVAATSSSTPATSTAQPSNTTVPATQSQPTDPLASTAPAPSASAKALFEVPSYTPQAGQPDPRDATYWANVAKLKFDDEQQYAELQRNQQRSDTDYADALQTAIRNRGVQQRTLGEDAIRSNLGNSGWLDRNEAEQTAAYTQDRAHAQLNKDEEDQARAAARTALQQGFSLEAAGELAAAAARFAQIQREEAANAPPELPGGGSPAISNAPAVPLSQQGPWPGNWPAPKPVQNKPISVNKVGIGKGKKAK